MVNGMIHLYILYQWLIVWSIDVYVIYAGLLSLLYKNSVKGNEFAFYGKGNTSNTWRTSEMYGKKGYRGQLDSHGHVASTSTLQ